MSDNTLGLQLNPEEATTSEAVDEPQVETPKSPTEETRPRAKGGYVNPDRVKTGGAQREKLGEDELAERMKRIRLQNEKIKQRRLDVEADKAAFQKTQQEERARLDRNRQVQADINRKRDEVARRKMEKAGNREWDSQKPAAARAAKNWAQDAQKDEKQEGEPEIHPSWGTQEVTTENVVDDSWGKQEPETTDDGWAKEGQTDDGWAKQPQVDKVDPSWDKQVAKEESQPTTSGWDTLGEYADFELPPEPEKPAATDDGWGAPADPSELAGQWTRGGSPSAFRPRGNGRGRGGRGRGRGRGGRGQAPNSTT